jgi:Arc/MetJ-type ribon-helix-helix transcriptional regulator
MPQPLTITLSSDLAEKVRAKAAAQGYASEEEYVQEHLADIVSDDSDLEEWLKTVGAARYDAYDANPKDVLTEDQVLSHVEQHLRQLRKAG